MYLLYRNMRHPRVVSFLATSVDADAVYLVTEYMKRGSLKDVRSVCTFDLMY